MMGESGRVQNHHFPLLGREAVQRGKGIFHPEGMGNVGQVIESKVFRNEGSGLFHDFYGEEAGSACRSRMHRKAPGIGKEVRHGAALRVALKEVAIFPLV